MTTFTKLSDPGAMDSLTGRLNALLPGSDRQWGRMTSHQMVCHLSDSFLVVSGHRPVARRRDHWFNRTVVKWVALHTSMTWPKGVKTMPEVDAEKGGTPPDIFERDRARAIELLWAFGAPTSAPAAHPLFGPLSRDEWMIWGYRHTDHHLRQFGG